MSFYTKERASVLFTKATNKVIFIHECRINWQYMIYTITINRTDVLIYLRLFDRILRPANLHILKRRNSGCKYFFGRVLAIKQDDPYL